MCLLHLSVKLVGVSVSSHELHRLALHSAARAFPSVCMCSSTEVHSVGAPIKLHIFHSLLRHPVFLASILVKPMVTPSISWCFHHSQRHVRTCCVAPLSVCTVFYSITIMEFSAHNFAYFFHGWCFCVCSTHKLLIAAAAELLQVMIGATLFAS